MALLLLQTQPVDLILTDVAMPHINGYELCRQIKNAPDSRLLLTPVILMSGRTLDSDIRYAKSLSVDDYLPKPSTGHRVGARFFRQLKNGY